MEASTPTQPYRCPVSHCTGWVVCVEDEEAPFWGCGECGSVWFQKANLLREIDSILALFPYRHSCYRQAEGEWLPTDPETIPKDYEERVEQEPWDDSDDSVRG